MNKIGIPLWKVGDNSFGSSWAYMAFASKFGEVIPLMPTHEVREDLDLLILPGGADLDPLRYGQEPNFYTGKPDMFKEHFDKKYLQAYIDAGVPIFGICRGHQTLAAHFGGQLIQHMSHETNDYTKDPYSAMHDIVFLDGFNTLRNFTEEVAIPVNSRHHQAVDWETLPEVLRVLAVHRSFGKNNHPGRSDNTIEMLGHIGLPIVSFQMHPEDMYEPTTNRFVRSIVQHLIVNKTSILI